jgi:hypothetical protein
MSIFAGVAGALGMAGGEMARTLAQIQQEERLRTADRMASEFRVKGLNQDAEQHRQTLAARKVETAAAEQRHRETLAASEAMELLRLQANPDLTVAPVEGADPSLPVNQRVSVNRVPFEQSTRGQELSATHASRMEQIGAENAADMGRTQWMYPQGKPTPLRITPEQRSVAASFLERHGENAEAALREQYGPDADMYVQGLHAEMNERRRIGMQNDQWNERNPLAAYTNETIGAQLRGTPPPAGGDTFFRGGSSFQDTVPRGGGSGLEGLSNEQLAQEVERRARAQRGGR